MLVFIQNLITHYLKVFTDILGGQSLKIKAFKKQ